MIIALKVLLIVLLALAIAMIFISSFSRRNLALVLSLPFILVSIFALVIAFKVGAWAWVKIGLIGSIVAVVIGAVPTSNARIDAPKNITAGIVAVILLTIAVAVQFIY